MTYYAGIDVSLEYSSVCVVDGAGKIMREQKIASEPEDYVETVRGEEVRGAYRRSIALASGRFAV